MLRSLLISVLSAFLAVWTTLLYQEWADRRQPPSSSVDNTATPTTTVTAPHDEHEADSQEQQQKDTTTTTNSNPTIIDVAQALGLGRVLLARGEAEEAALAFRVAAAAAAAPTAAAAGTKHYHGQAQHGLGLALRAAGRPEEAIEACREAERLDPELAAASACVGALLTESGDAIGALKALRSAAVKVDNRGAASAAGEETADEIHGRLGAALVAAGEVDEAIPMLMRALEGVAVGSWDAHAAYNLGVAWQSKVSRTAAVSYDERGISPSERYRVPPA